MGASRRKFICCTDVRVMGGGTPVTLLLAMTGLVTERANIRCILQSFTELAEEAVQSIASLLGQ